MCKTYHTIGSLTTLKSKLYESNIYDFKSLKEVLDFQDSYQNIRQQLISHHKNIIEKEIEELKAELAYLTTEIEKQKKQAEKGIRSEIEIMKERMNVSLSEFHKGVSNNMF
jgi:ABC-type phosphate transport system auxiliary subunit